MASAPDVERFKGARWEECHDFIAAIRARALSEGKQRDASWMADYATPLFWGKALSWHGRLSQDVRQDWFKLEAALLDRWSPPEDDDAPDGQRSAAAAPSVNRTDDANRPLQGVLKVVEDGSNTEYYVKEPDGNSECYLTKDMEVALRVRCNSLSSPTLLETIDHSCHSWLVVRWINSRNNFGDGSTDYAVVTSPDPGSLKLFSGANAPPQLMKCLVSANGQVIPVWSKSDSYEVTLSPFVDSPSLFFAVDPVAYCQDYPNEKRATLFIEPVD